MYHSSYLGEIFKDPKSYSKLVKVAIKKTKALQKTLKFEAIAFRGISGSALAYPISAELKIPLIHLRKAKERCHGSSVEAWDGASIQRYVILDDFIETGKSVREIMDYFADYGDSDMECVGILLWSKQSGYLESSSRDFTYKKTGKTYKIYKLYGG